MISKVIKPGQIKMHGSVGEFRCSVFCKIEYKDGKLSISGVEGPMSNGDAHGSCGQIEMGYKHGNPDYDDKRYSSHTEIKHFAAGWTKEMWLKFLDIWHEWHLNDMRPYCEHQKELGWRKLCSQEVTLYHWRLKSEHVQEQSRIENHVIDCAKQNTNPILSDDQRLLLTLEYGITTHTERVDEKIAKYYESKTSIYNGDKTHTEKKTLGWLRPSEHPDGILCKPCPVCGYKYGAEWKKESVPTDVLDFLAKLPDADTKPAWV